MVEFNSLSDKLTSEWHPTKNGVLTPLTVFPISKTLVWWQCELGHEWEATVVSRNTGSACPFCSNRKVLKGFNDLLNKFPSIASEWDFVKNKSLKPDEVVSGVWKKAWWLCQLGHSYEANIGSRTSNRRTGCPFCSGNRTLTGFNDLLSRNPKVASEWDPTKNGGLVPSGVNWKSNKKIWWLCEKGHSYEAYISVRTGKSDNSCPCHSSSSKRILVGFNDLATTHPFLASEWHPIKNETKPDGVTSGSSRKVWWLCEKGHEWEVSINNRARRGSSCPFCSGRKAIIGETDLATTSPKLASQWHPTKNSQLKPTQIKKGAEIKVWWQCEEGHEWEAMAYSRSSKGAHGCPVCSNQVVLVGLNDLLTKNPKVASEWHPMKNGLRLPSEFTVRSGYRAWWLCGEGHEWESLISNRSAGYGCPVCVAFQSSSVGEGELADFVVGLGFGAVRNSRQIIAPLELDIFVPSLNVAIEFNGIYWHSDEHVSRTYHYDKWFACKEQGIQLIQIWEDDWRDKQELVKGLLEVKLSSLVNAFPEEGSGILGETQVKVGSVSRLVCESFLDEHHLDSSLGLGGMGLKFWGLFETSTGDIDVLVAVIVTRTTPNTQTLKVVRYSALRPSVSSLGSLLSYVLSVFPTVIEVISEVSNCFPEDELYTTLGFKSVKQIKPDYTFLEVNKRVPKELAEGTDFPKVWNSGRTFWVKDLIFFIS